MTKELHISNAVQYNRHVVTNFLVTQVNLSKNKLYAVQGCEKGWRTTHLNRGRLDLTWRTFTLLALLWEKEWLARTGVRKKTSRCLMRNIWYDFAVV